MISAFGKQFVSAAMFKLVNDILTFVGPYLLSAVIVFLQVLYCTVHSLPCVRLQVGSQATWSALHAIAPSLQTGVRC